jgi:hypothetical protein
MDTRRIIEVLAAVAIPLAFLAVLIRAYLQPEGIGVRTVQLTTIGMVVPLILILGMENILEAQSIGTLIGGLIGYALSGVSRRPKGETQP